MKQDQCNTNTPITFLLRSYVVDKVGFGYITYIYPVRETRTEIEQLVFYTSWSSIVCMFL